MIDIISFGLNKNTIDKLVGVFSNFPEIEEVIIYGSRVKGNYKPGSDIDLAFKGELLTHNILNKISNQIEELLLPYIIEPVLYKNIENNDLLEHINRIGQTFYKKV